MCLGVRTINTRLSFIGSVVVVVCGARSIVIEKYQFRPHLAKWLGYYLYPKLKEFHGKRTYSGLILYGVERYLDFSTNLGCN